MKDIRNINQLIDDNYINLNEDGFDDEDNIFDELIPVDEFIHLLGGLDNE